MKQFAKALSNELEPMWRFALRLTANEADAEDLVQQTCVKALESVQSYQEQGRLRSWLFRIEHRIWLNVLRSRQIRSEGSFNKSNRNLDSLIAQNCVAVDPSSNYRLFVDDHSPESQLRLHQIFLQVESLVEAQRLVVILVCVEGFTYHETAQILDIPIGTVMSRLARARFSLGKAMLAEQDERQTAEVDGGP